MVSFHHRGGKGVGEGQHLKTTSPVDGMMKQPYQKKPPLFRLYTAMWREGLACSGLSTSVLVEQGGVGKIRGSWDGAGKRRALLYEIPREYAFLPYGHLDFESAVTAQNDKFKVVFIVARLHVHQTSRFGQETQS